MEETGRGGEHHGRVYERYARFGQTEIDRRLTARASYRRRERVRRAYIFARYDLQAPADG